MWKNLGYHLLACGKDSLPDEINFNGHTYRLKKILKHDFFAATALYKSSHRSQANHPDKVILKINRRNHFLGMPMNWLGRAITRHELDILRRLSSLSQVPRLITKYEKTGFIYEYIEGQTLDESANLPEDFFDRLTELLQQVHQQNIIYLDTNKRSNIILGADGRPHLIDFQISLYLHQDQIIGQRLFKNLKKVLENIDFYHLLKHKRRLCPHLLRPDEQDKCRRHQLIELHRFVATPLRKLRRKTLARLKDKGVTAVEQETERH